MLEYSLVQEHQPHFNGRLKDDKSFPYLAITRFDEWPRARVMRGKKRKGVEYFGRALARADRVIALDGAHGEGEQRVGGGDRGRLGLGVVGEGLAQRPCDHLTTEGRALHHIERAQRRVATERRRKAGFFREPGDVARIEAERDKILLHQRDPRAAL